MAGGEVDVSYGPHEDGFPGLETLQDGQEGHLSIGPIAPYISWQSRVEQ